MKRFNTNSTAGKVVLNTLVLPTLLLMLCAFTLAKTASADELVVNGWFELPVVSTVDPVWGWMTYYGGNKPLGAPGDCPTDTGDLPENCNDDTRVPGWSVFWTDKIIEVQQLTPGRLEIQSNVLYGLDNPTYEGAQLAELDSEHRITIPLKLDEAPNNNATITQWLPTCPLEEYTLSYAWKARTANTGDNDLRVWVDTWLDTDGKPDVLMHTENLPFWSAEEVTFTSDNSGQTLILFGSVGTQSGEGGYLDAVSVNGPDCSFVCDEKPYDITFRYDGDDDSHHSQSGNEVIIYPEEVYPFPNPATIKVYGHNKRKPEPLGTFENVEINDLFSVSNIKQNKRIPPRLVFQIYDPEDEGGMPVQTVMFHTSCSQPLNGHDEFGAITVWNALP